MNAERGRTPPELVSTLSCVANLTVEERSALGAMSCESISYRAGESITRSGESPSTCFLVLEGFVSTSKATKGGSRQITCFFVPGDLPDLRTLHLKKGDSDLAALTACRLAVLAQAELLALSRTYSGIAEALWTYTLVVSSIFQEWIVNVGARAGVSRLAHLLCEMTTRLELAGLAREGRCDLPLTQSHLAEATGMSRIHVNRSLGELRRQGLVTLGFDELVIHDWEGLARVGQFDSSYLGPLQPRWRSTSVRDS